MNSDAVKEQLLTSHRTENGGDPFLTVAVPHYKHRRYLEASLASIFEQTFEDFEIVISDDCSPDDSNTVIPLLLQQSGRQFRYYEQTRNLGYDGNVRFCLSAAQGRYVFLLGNDDALCEPETLEKLAAMLRQLELPEVAFTNYKDWMTGETVERASRTQLLGAGAEAAIRHFRAFSFVSGLIFDRKQASLHETDRWDRSIYYQIYLASRIAASDGRIAAINICTVRKDVRIDGNPVPSYATKWANAAWSFQSRHTGLESVIRVTADAVLPSLPQNKRSRALRRIVTQILTVTYPHWLFEYRRIANWSFAVGVARSLWPGTLLAEHHSLKATDRGFLYMLYFIVSFVGLTFPSSLFARLRSRLAMFVRHRLQSRAIVEQH